MKVRTGSARRGESSQVPPTLRDSSFATTLLPTRLEPLHVVGSPKAGLRIIADEEGSVLTFHGRADPLLVYFVFGTAVAVAVAGSVLFSPGYGLAGVMLLSLLFLPLIVFAALGALRLRTTCRIARGDGRIEVVERSYAGALRRTWPLTHLARVLIAVRPPAGISGSVPTHELYLDFGKEQYLVRTATRDRGIRRDAQRTARFLGLAMHVEQLPNAGRRTSRRHVVLLAILFVLPLVGSTLGFSYLFRGNPPSTSLMIISMSALVVCQVGAILAYAYDRSRHGRGNG